VNNPVQRLARAAARAEDRPGLTGSFYVRAIPFACLTIFAFAGVPFGFIGLWVGIGVGTVVSFALPFYGSRLERRATGRLGSPRERRARVAKLLDAVADHLTPQRVSDARLMIDAGCEDEAMGLIVADLQAANSTLTPAQTAALSSAAASTGLGGDAGIRRLAERR
jgi:ABC-type lipoprotein release transport system permease subunit